MNDETDGLYDLYERGTLLFLTLLGLPRPNALNEIIST
jgi:hypothetical protein